MEPLRTLLSNKQRHGDKEDDSRHGPLPLSLPPLIPEQGVESTASWDSQPLGKGQARRLSSP